MLLAGKGKEKGGTVWRLSGADEDGRGSLALFWESNHQGPRVTVWRKIPSRGRRRPCFFEKKIGLGLGFFVFFLNVQN